ncbi:MAG: hypothetical protein H7831_14150 [Magnetococcus sp. WYHC-3]
MAWKKIGSGWDTERGGISLSMKEGETFERAYLFPVREKKQSRSPDWDLCIKTDAVAEERPRHDPRERDEEPQREKGMTEEPLPF